MYIVYIYNILCNIILYKVIHQAIYAYLHFPLKGNEFNRIVEIFNLKNVTLKDKRH